ncbi:MAG: PASTA domain-containing protein [Butyricicoccus sp.]|nr:PASTA domain-containing protein [Butyricicoccus sp.]
MAIKGPDNNMRRRLSLLTLLICVGCVVGVAFKLFNMQVIDHDHWTAKASDFQTEDDIIQPSRGTIYDTNMNELAVSAGSELIYVDPSSVINKANTENGYSDEQQQARMAELLSEVLGVDYNIVLENVQMTDKRWRKIKANVDKDTADELRQIVSDARKKNADGSEPAGYYVYSGIGYETDVTRYYPNGAFASQLIGFTNSEGVGSNGIEEKYNDVLSGTPGRVVRAATPDGEDMPYDYEEYIPAADGSSIVLTIDSTVQSIVEKHCETALADNPHAEGGVQGIVMDVETGAILAMANLPDYNLNENYTISRDELRYELYEDIGEELEKVDQDPALANSLSQEYLTYGGSTWLTSEQLSNEELVNILTVQRKATLEKMWRNNIVKDAYEPGSTFKLFTVASALEAGIISSTDTFFCDGGYQVDEDTYIRCHKKEGHGMQSLTETLMNSCNDAMMQIAYNMKHNRFKEYMEAFGLFETTGLDFNGEGKGYFYQNERDWLRNSALMTASFGQRFIITPLQMLNMTAAIVDDGYLKTPYLVREILNADGTVQSTTQTEIKRQVISAETSAFMRSAMEQVVSSGTGKNAYVAGYRIGGKTATSELKRDHNGEMHYTASFIGVAPIDDPKYIALVVISDIPDSYPHGGGAIAAPVVGRIFADILPYLGVEPVFEETEMERMDVVTPNIIGQTKDQAAAAALEAGLTYRYLGEGETVSDQVPSVGAKVPYGSEMIIYLGGRTKTSEQREVPYVLGQTPESVDYELYLSNLYLKCTGIASSQYNYQTAAVKQNPAAGTMVDVGTVITVEFQSSSGVSDR